MATRKISTQPTKLNVIAYSTAIALAGTVTCNSVTLKNVGDNMFPLKVTMEFAVKLLPVKVSVNDGPPAVVLAGTRAPTTGWMFAARMVRVTGLVVSAPPAPIAGFVTVIVAVPGFAMSLAEMAIVSCTEDLKVVCRATPLKFTTELWTKFEPTTKSVNPAAPATALDGLMPERIGAELEAATGGM